MLVFPPQRFLAPAIGRLLSGCVYVCTQSLWIVPLFSVFRLFKLNIFSWWYKLSCWDGKLPIGGLGHQMRMISNLCAAAGWQHCSGGYWLIRSVAAHSQEKEHPKGGKTIPFFSSSYLKIWKWSLSVSSFYIRDVIFLVLAFKSEVM